MTASESTSLPGSAERVTVYVQLLNEGTIVYRPASGTSVGPDVVRLELVPDYDPENEQWEFLPGSVVRVEQRRLSDGDVRVAIRRIE